MTHGLIKLSSHKVAARRKTGGGFFLGEYREEDTVPDSGQEYFVEDSSAVSQLCRACRCDFDSRSGADRAPHTAIAARRIEPAVRPDQRA